MGGAPYSPAFKGKLLEKLLGPNAHSACSLSREVGIPQTTLSRWMREAVTLKDMGKKKRKSWSAEEKLRIVVQASELPEEELGAFLRREGVHSSQLEQWRETVQGALTGGQTSESRRQAQRDRKRIRKLEQELRRKDKALAETAALLVLQKKVQAIWGEPEDEKSSYGSGEK